MQDQERLHRVFTDSRLFSGVGAETLARLAPQAGTLREGDLLFREGDTADHAYVIEEGILGLFTGEHSGSSAYFRKALRGDLVGEYGLLCAERRSASAVALTELSFLKFGKADFEALLENNPILQGRLITALATAASVGRDPRQCPLNAIVLHCEHPDSPLTRRVLAQLPRHLREEEQAHRVRDRAEVEAGDPGEEELHERLRQATTSGDLRIFLISCPTALSHRNLQLIDRLIVLRDGTLPPAPWNQALNHKAHLVRLWPRGQERPESPAWDADLRPAQVINIQPDRRGHLGRLARTVLRLQTVLVLGGGGARGFAHIGALAAMEEVGLDDTDVVMGVSIGSLVASLLAFGLSSGEILSQLERVIIRSRPYNLTLPRDALFTLANSRREMELFFGSTRIQDCWLSLHCFSTNLSRNRLQAWCLGSIPTAVIASMSVPGIFPPVEDSRGELHVDGGILDNLPIAAARGLSDGRVIAVSLDVDPDSADEDSPDRKRRRSSLARTIISAMMCASHSQSRAQENLADLVLKPEIGAYPFLDWKSYREIFLAGQSHARSRLGDGTRFRRPAAPRS